MHYGPYESERYLERQLERQWADRGVLAFCGIKLPWLEPPPVKPVPMWQREQAIGEACGGKSLDPCKAFFGDVQLSIACRTCPGIG